jgi:hypothetical protein
MAYNASSVAAGEMSVTLAKQGTVLGMCGIASRHIMVHAITAARARCLAGGKAATWRVACCQFQQKISIKYLLVTWGGGIL